MKHYNARILNSAVLLLVALNFCLSSQSQQVFAQEKEKYEIRMFYPSKIGEKQRYVADFDKHIKIHVSKGEKVIREGGTKNSIELDVELETTRLTTKNAIGDELATVHKALLKSEKGTPKEIVPKETKIKILSKDSTVTYIDLETGKSLQGIAAQLFPQLVGPAGEVPTDEEMFGSPKSRTIGESWEGNAELIAEYLSAKGQKFEAKDVASKAKFIGIKTEKNKKYFEIETFIRAKTKNPKSPPPGTEPVLVTLTATKRLIVPVDYSSPPVGQTFTLDIVGHFIGKEDSGQIAGAKIIFSSHEKRIAKITWLSK